MPCSTIGSCSPVVDFVWECLNRKIPMKFVGGVLGTDNIDGFNTPVFGYAVTVVD
jgi:hypothetical protein